MKIIGGNEVWAAMSNGCRARTGRRVVRRSMSGKADASLVAVSFDDRWPSTKRQITLIEEICALMALT
ncbi:MAG TPA: hypothetical protein PKL33_03305 [Accumulibacter sp.]|nr:hypothetical protein [Accumulibacter sp.]